MKNLIFYQFLFLMLMISCGGTSKQITCIKLERVGIQDAFHFKILLSDEKQSCEKAAMVNLDSLTHKSFLVPNSTLQKIEELIIKYNLNPEISNDNLIYGFKISLFSKSGQTKDYYLEDENRYSEFFDEIKAIVTGNSEPEIKQALNSLYDSTIR